MEIEPAYRLNIMSGCFFSVWWLDWLSLEPSLLVAVAIEEPRTVA